VIRFQDHRNVTPGGGEDGDQDWKCADVHARSERLALTFAM
jgi:hypothetical protein